jgi:hypothetical protein
LLAFCLLAKILADFSWFVFYLLTLLLNHRNKAYTTTLALIKKMSVKIPENFTEFLYWIKERTEKFWALKREVQDDENHEIENWAYNAKWIGLSEQEIDNVEIKYGIKFTKFHREFLSILHTVDRKQKNQSWDENGNSIIIESSFFHNWLNDEEEIKKYLSWPKDFLLDDVLRGAIWLKSWGKKSNSKTEQKSIFLNWFTQAPNLIPINSHRFVINEPRDFDNPILSIYGQDTILYGGNMRHYLLNELEDELSLRQGIFDIEFNEWDSKLIPEVEKIHNLEYDLLKTKDIPYWKEFLISNGHNDYLTEN